MGDLLPQLIQWIANNPGTAISGIVGTGGTGGVVTLLIQWSKANRAFRHDMREQQADLKTQQVSLKEAHDELQETTNDRIVMLEGTVDFLRKQYDAIKKERDVMHEELEDIRRQLVDAAKRENAKSKVIKTLEAEVVRLEEENQTKTITIEQLRQEIASLHQQIAWLTHPEGGVGNTDTQQLA